MKTATLRLLEGINGLYVFSLSCVITGYYATLTAAATKTNPIGDDDNRQFTIIVNSTSTAAPIGLPPKTAKFCHTSNRSLLVRQCRRALLRLYFNSSATGWRSVIGGRWSVVGGRWLVVGGRWSVVGGRWLVVGGRWSVVGGRWSVVGGRWSVVGGWWLVVGGWLEI
jgi:hypothetical protein